MIVCDWAMMTAGLVALASFISYMAGREAEADRQAEYTRRTRMSGKR